MLRYQRGDAAAFDTLYGRHKGALFRYFLRHNPHSRETAQELFQELWLRLIRQRARYQPSAKFNTYLYTLAHSCQVDHWRGNQRRPGDQPGDADPDELQQPATSGPEHRADLMAAGEQICAQLRALPEAQREAFLLREEAGLSLEEIAQVTGVGRETAKSRLRYAVARLRDRLHAVKETA